MRISDWSSDVCSSDLLDESKLAQHFGVSRTPVREALRELAAADLVVLRPRQGAVVATVTVTQLLHMFEVMAELESFCARLAARRMTAEERRHLTEVHDACRTHLGTAPWRDNVWPNV